MHPRNDQNRYARERKLPIFPVRGSVDSQSTPMRPVSPPKPVRTPRDSASERINLGFDDIPTDDENMNDVRFRDILAAWLKQSTKHSPLEKNLRRFSKLIKNHRLASWKNDIKWALQADLDEPVKPRPKTPLARPSLPSTSQVKPKKRQKKLPDLSRKQLIIVAVCVVLIGIGAYQFFLKPSSVKKLGTPGAPSVTTTKLAQKPEYNTVLPAGKSIESLGGWKRVSPPGKDPVFAYADKVGTVQINVSQQPLPHDFKQDTAEDIAKLAEGYQADEKVTVGDTIAYIGTSAQGPQSVILTKSGLLILIKSSAKLTSNQWAEYVNSLE